MKRSNQSLRMILIIIALFFLTGCSATTAKHDSVGDSVATETVELSTDVTVVNEMRPSANEVEISEYQIKRMTFEELVEISNAAIIGQFKETIEHEYYTETVFEVKECLYGDVSEDEIYLYSNVGTAYVNEADYSYELGNTEYNPEEEYILVMEKRQSIMYDHDRYLLVGDILLNDSTKEYTLYSETIEIPEDTSAREFICSVYASVENPVQSKEIVHYESEVAEMLGESDYVGVVHINELVTPAKTTNGNTYSCSVESLLKGEQLNTYPDGTIYLKLLKDKVKVDNSYIIGFSSVGGADSLVYIQTTKTSVYELNDSLLSDITDTQTELLVR